MKIWLLILLVPFSVNAENFTVEIDTLRGLKTFYVSAPTDEMALDSVLIGVIYNKKLRLRGSAIVKETGLTNLEFKPILFKIITEHKNYFIEIPVANPRYAVTAIQASRSLMSRTATQDVFLMYKKDHLKRREATKYMLELSDRQVPYLLNSNSIEEGQVALEIAAKVSHLNKTFKSVKIPSYTCLKMFAY